MVYLGLRTSDIYENNNTKVKFHPIKAETNLTGEDLLIISNVETNEELKITVHDFRANYSLIQAGSLSEKSFFI